MVTCSCVCTPVFAARPSQASGFSNPQYDTDPCRRTRFAELLWLTPEECDYGRRLLFAVIVGSVIGWERRQADRPAGIRTMALVSLGSCLFTLTSAFAFTSGPMCEFTRPSCFLVYSRQTNYACSIPGHCVHTAG